MDTNQEAFEVLTKMLQEEIDERCGPWPGSNGEIPFIEYGDLDPRVAWVAEHVARALAVRGC